MGSERLERGNNKVRGGGEWEEWVAESLREVTIR